ncbi:hypothetical protein E2C01_008219 [Portunus trituberculatus]|uniref:Uncharacterized protein n=1 Tax=Portunus trituberculatus TaxID=210409 RepID=A0A5B7D074_PORTR|nr:hypothetical protein [Portunus trituberculatus]
MNLSSAYPSKVAQSATFRPFYAAQGSVGLHFRLAGWGRICGGGGQDMNVKLASQLVEP